MTYSFRPAKRSEAKPLIGLYAESGAGKTMSALLLARGFAGPNGKVGMIETEAGRGEAYADIIPGSYDVLPIRNVFSPKNFGDALTAAEENKLDALIIDSASHEWSGAGGVLSMAADNQSAGMKGVLVWQKPKMEHSRLFMLRLLSTPIPLVIVCMRAKYPMVEQKVGEGSKQWVRSPDLEPDQAADILFEMFVHGWIDREHKLHVTKLTRPDLADVFRNNEMIDVHTGERLALWSRSEKPSSHPPASPRATTKEPAPAPSEPSLTGAGTLSLKDMAREAAKRGEPVFKTFYKSRSDPEKKILNSMGDELRGLMSGTS